MNTSYLWALPVALGLVLVAWAVLRRRPPQDAERRAAPADASQRVAAPQPERPADASSVAAQHQAATEALRQARRRKAEEEARLDAERAAQRPTAAPLAPRPALRPAPRTMPQPAAAAEPIIPVLSPLAIQINTGRTPTAKPPPAGLAPLRATPQRVGPPTVLVVDDSKVVRIKTGRLLEKQGWRVLLADDGQAALVCLETETPDLLITDVEMPGLDGFELTRLLRGSARWARLPVIMITSSDDKHRAEAANAGVNVLLGKPYSEETLLAQAMHLLGSAVPQGTPALH